MTLDEFLKLPGAKVHDGSGCPVDGDAMPGILFRGGMAYEPGDEIASWWDWEHDPFDSALDIIAYREVQP